MMAAATCAILLTPVVKRDWICVILLAVLLTSGRLVSAQELVSSGRIAGSWYQSTRSPEDSKHHKDDDSDEDDEDDDNERTNSVVVAAIPVVLGVLAIVLLCVFMMCRRNSQNREQAKWAVRQQRSSLTTTTLDDPERLDHSQYDTINYVATSATIQETCTPSAPPEVASDLPPSYEEVMRDVRRTDTNHVVT